MPKTERFDIDSALFESKRRTDMNIIERLGFEPLKAIPLPQTNEYVVAMIKARSCMYVTGTNEVITINDGIILMDGDKEDDTYLFNNKVEEVNIPLNGYLLEVYENISKVSDEIGGDDNRPTSLVFEYAVDSYVIPSIKAVPTYRSDYHGMCDIITKHYTKGDKS